MTYRRPKAKMQVIFVIALLFSSILQNGLLLASVQAQSPAALISVTPSNVSVVSFGKFNVTITVTNVTDLYAWQTMLLYDAAILNATSAWRLWSPEYVFYGKSSNPVTLINNTAGFVLCGDSLLGPQPTFNGSGKLCQIEFQPKTLGTASLNLSRPLEGEGSKTFLLDNNLNFIRLDAEDGLTQAKFRIGDRVQTTANLNVREGPGLSYTIIDTMLEGTLGQIVGGPEEADGYVWWEVDYDGGVRGWSAENWLELAAAPPAPDFSITASPSSLTIQQGSSGSSTITITSINGFNQPVQLTVSGAPSGVTATFNPQQITPPAGGSITSTLTVSVGISATLGSYTLTVTGTNGALVHSAYISLEVIAGPPAPTFLLTVFTLFGGSTDPLSGTYRYDEGRVVTINAIPNSGFEFEYWELDGSNMGATNPLSVTMDKDHFLSANFRILPAAPKILPVPYYSQGITDWCVPTSMSMIFKYYGYPLHSWQIAKDLGWGRTEVPDFWQDQLFAVKSYFEQGVQEKRDLSPLPAEMYTCFLTPPSFGDIRDWIDDGRPILLVMHSMEHAVVVVGYGYSVSGSEKVYVHDPAGGYLNEIMDLHLPRPYPGIAIELDWSSLVEFIDCSVVTPSYLFAVGGDPNPPKGTIDLQDYGFYFCLEKNKGLPQVYSWLTGPWWEGDGLMWEHFPRHPLTLSPQDLFRFEKYIVNHMSGLQSYFLEVEFKTESYTSSKGFLVHVEGCDSSTPMEPIALRDVLEYYGEYTITLKLWGEWYSELYDEIVLPKIDYKPYAEYSLNSPADLYITDPQGRHVGIDSSTGQVINEIPDAVYTGSGSEPQVIAIPDPLDGDYVVLLIGRAAGTYSLTAELVTLQGVTAFSATGIPTATGALHKYCIDWAALSLREEGVTVQVDSDGDGQPEHTFTSDDELTRDELLTVLCDFNGDKKIDVKDIALAARAFGETPTRPRWNPQVDINQDGKIDVKDVSLIARNFGKKYT